MAWTIGLRNGKKDVCERFDIVLMGEDISIVTEKLCYATLGNGSHYGIQHCFENGGDEEMLLRRHCDAIYDHLLAVNKIINKDLYENEQTNQRTQEEA